MNLRVVKPILLGLMIVGTGFFVRDRAKSHDVFWVVVSVAFLVVTILRQLLRARRTYLRLRGEFSQGMTAKAGVDTLVKEALPSVTVGYYTVEKKLYAAVWDVIRFKQMPATNVFSTVRTSSHRLVVSILVFVALGLGVCGFAWASMSVDGNLSRTLSQCGAVLLTAYSLVWILGDSRILQESGHAIRADGVALALGIRCTGFLPASAVVRPMLVSGSFAQFLRQRGIALRQVESITVAGMPNVFIELKEGTALDLVKFGYARNIKKDYLALRVDHPDAFVAALSKVDAEKSQE